MDLAWLERRTDEDDVLRWDRKTSVLFVLCRRRAAGATDKLFLLAERAIGVPARAQLPAGRRASSGHCYCCTLRCLVEWSDGFVRGLLSTGGCVTSRAEARMAKLSLPTTQQRTCASCDHRQARQKHSVCRTLPTQRFDATRLGTSLSQISLTRISPSTRSYPNDVVRGVIVQNKTVALSSLWAVCA